MKNNLILHDYIYTILLLVMGSDGSNTILLNVERGHLLVIELEHPIFGFKRTDIEHLT